MAGSPKKLNPFLLIFFFVAIVVVSVLATVTYHKFGSPEKLADTAIRSRLLQDKDHQLTFENYQPTDSVSYSNIIYDFKVSSPSDFKLPWVDFVRESPDGVYSFAWRLKLTFPALFSAVTSGSRAGDFSVELTGRDGAARYIKTDTIVLPKESVALEPGIYLLKVNSARPFDFLNVSFARSEVLLHESSPNNKNAISALHLEFDARAEDGLKRFVELALQSTKGMVIKTPKSRVAAELLPGNGKAALTAMIGLSGRTREHMTDFPSLDVKIKGGKAFNGLSSFKLYKLSTKSGLYDFVILSVLRDMGFFVPRQELVKLYVNGEIKGSYILMETFNAESFTAQKRLEGDIVGVDSDKMFFDYPYGGTLENRYFYRPGESSYKKRGTRFFLSSDFSEAVDVDYTAKYLSLSALYLLTHGLGIDDLRFYLDPATGVFQPIPRDLNPGSWGTVEKHRVFLTHFVWWVESPPYTIWPIRGLRNYEYRFNRSERIFVDDVSSTGVTDLHYTFPPFLSKAERMEAVNKYLDFYSTNFALKEKIDKRLENTLSQALKADPRNGLIRNQLLYIRKNGARFMGNLFRIYPQSDGLKFSDEEGTYLWNIRTSEKLDRELMPSFLSPTAHQITEDELYNLYALTFLIEKKIFDTLEEAGISIGKKSYKRIEEPARGSGSMPMRLRAHRGLKKQDGTEIEVVFTNVVKYLSTLTLESDRALVLFLVRNATDDVTDYKLKMRDSLVTISPRVSKSFIIKEDPEWNRSSILQIMNNQFLRGESLRLLAFEIPLTKNAEFYTMRLPTGSWRLFVPWMYVPPKGTSETLKTATPIDFPREIVERGGAFHIPANTEILVNNDLVIPKGKAFYIGEGVTLKISPGSSIKVTGDLFISGSLKRPVRFVSAGAEPWGGLYVAGSNSAKAKATFKNVSFDNYGAFPKTRVADLYLNGGITFYNADVSVENLSVTNARSEDAVNFISSFVLIDGMEIDKAFSDAVDMDFSYGLIQRLRTTESNGDGLDLSASLVRLVDSVLERSKDKGLSIGEMSRVHVLNTRFIGNNMGIANKDQSRLEVMESFFIENDTALAEFIKKPSYGRPKATMKDNIYRDNKQDYEWLGFHFY